MHLSKSSAQFVTHAGHGVSMSAHCRHERSKGEDGLRINYWYLIRPDGGEDLAVIGREIKGSGGHYNYNSVRHACPPSTSDPHLPRCLHSQPLKNSTVAHRELLHLLTPGYPASSHTATWFIL